MTATISTFSAADQPDEQSAEAQPLLTALLADREEDDAAIAEGDEAGLLPPLLRRPSPCPPPAGTKALKTPAEALRNNPQVSLDENAVRTLTSGVVNPPVFRGLVAITGRTKNFPDGVSLLAEKPVIGGALYATGNHLRYVDDAIIADLRNGRWGHLIHVATDTTGTHRPGGYSPLVGPDGEQYAILTIHLKDRQELRKAIRSSLQQTIAAGTTTDAPGAGNDYTESVLQKGIKEPLLLFVLRVTYDDGGADTYLMAGDGNSRLLSVWRARTGGNVDDAIAAMLDTVLGPNPDKPRDTRKVRAGITAMCDRVNRGLREDPLTEETIREGHTIAVPAVVVVGMRSDEAAQPLDLVAAQEELVEGLHVNNTPWVRAARHNQGMRRLLRTAAETGLITEQPVLQVLSGAASTTTMSRTLDLPPHPLWAAALWIRQVTGPRRDDFSALFRQTFGLAQAQRKPVGERLGVVALASFRSRKTDIKVNQALNAFADGGPLTDAVLRTDWTLTRGHDPQVVLDAIRDAALAGDVSARCELTVLGGVAAMLTGLLSRDRGSKEGTKRDAQHSPYRRTPYRLLEMLVRSDGGIRTLHSIASTFVKADDGAQPKQFAADGSPLLDGARAQKTLQYEWDLFATADPALTAAVIAAAPSDTDTDTSPAPDNRTEDEKQRGDLINGLNKAGKAVRSLAVMAQTGGNTVMGLPDFVEDCQRRAEKIRDTLIRHTPPAGSASSGEFTDEDHDPFDDAQ